MICSTALAPSSTFRKPQPRRASMARLGDLPLELLEKIFLLSMEPALTQSAPAVGRALSSRATCLRFCMRAFFDAAAAAALQSAVLASRFFTWPFFLAYVARAHATHFCARGRGWASTGLRVPDAGCFHGLLPHRFTQVAYLGLAEGFRVPAKLVRRRFTPDKTALLYVLVAFGGELDAEAGEVAQSGLLDAVDEDNESAVAALSVLLGTSAKIPGRVLAFAVSRGCNLNIVRHILFNAQITDTPLSRSPLYTDFCASVHTWLSQAEGPQLDDPSGLDSGSPADGGERLWKRQQLQQALARASIFSLDFYMNGEDEWDRLMPFPYSGSKFNARHRLDPVLRELLLKLYRNHGRRIIGGLRHRIR